MPLYLYTNHKIFFIKIYISFKYLVFFYRYTLQILIELFSFSPPAAISDVVTFRTPGRMSNS